MSRVRMLDTDELLTEEVWENNSEEEGGIEEDIEDDYWFGEETGHGEVTDQGTSEVRVLGKSKKRTRKIGVEVGTKKSKEVSNQDPIMKALEDMNKRFDDLAEENRGLKRRLKKKKKYKK